MSLLIVPAVRAGDVADGIRFISRLCDCPWTGPHFSTRPAHYRRAGTDPSCRLHGGEAAVRRARAALREAAA
jgi:hypothetical protein